MTFERMVEEIIVEGDIIGKFPSLASRISVGSDEVRNILKTGKVTSKGPYGGHTFFGTKGPEEFPASMRSFWNAYGQEGPFQPGKKAGYVLKGDASKMRTPSANIDPSTAGVKDPSWYKNKGFVTLPPDSSADNIKTIQRIKQPKGSWNEPGVLGKERNFNRFMQIYNKLADAFKRGKIKLPPPRLTPGANLAAGVAALAQFMNSEVPPDVKNSLLGGGGLGIKGKFEANP